MRGAGTATVLPGAVPGGPDGRRGRLAVRVAAESGRPSGARWVPVPLRRGASVRGTAFDGAAFDGAAVCRSADEAAVCGGAVCGGVVRAAATGGRGGVVVGAPGRRCPPSS
ncbi:hypothetical protein, partial [Pseudonocardia alni]|uniref:hypothetical protein n=1 Tax=Pseudonocardia alni TaxID=33907 RepID=UPI00332C1CAE